MTPHNGKRRSRAGPRLPVTIALAGLSYPVARETVKTIEGAGEGKRGKGPHTHLTHMVEIIKK